MRKWNCLILAAAATQTAIGSETTQVSCMGVTAMSPVAVVNERHEITDAGHSWCSFSEVTESERSEDEREALFSLSRYSHLVFEPYSKAEVIAVHKYRFTNELGVYLNWPTLYQIRKTDVSSIGGVPVLCAEVTGNDVHEYLCTAFDGSYGWTLSVNMRSEYFSSEAQLKRFLSTFKFDDAE